MVNFSSLVFWYPTDRPLCSNQKTFLHPPSFSPRLRLHCLECWNFFECIVQLNDWIDPIFGSNHWSTFDAWTPNYLSVREKGVSVGSVIIHIYFGCNYRVCIQLTQIQNILLDQQLIPFQLLHLFQALIMQGVFHRFQFIQTNFRRGYLFGTINVLLSTTIQNLKNSTQTTEFLNYWIIYLNFVLRSSYWSSVSLRLSIRFSNCVISSLFIDQTPSYCSAILDFLSIISSFENNWPFFSSAENLSESNRKAIRYQPKSSDRNYLEYLIFGFLKEKRERSNLLK